MNGWRIRSAASCQRCTRASGMPAASPSLAANTRALYHSALNSTRSPERGITGRPCSIEFIHDAGVVEPRVWSRPVEASTRRLGWALSSM